MRTHTKPRGGITAYGYRRITCKDRKQRFEHVLVWEEHHGPIPSGMEIHHINGNKLDNRIENLAMLTRLDHKRIHSGCLRINGEWWKRCRRCQWLRPIGTEFYVYPGRNGVMGVCRRCQCQVSVAYKKQRRVTAAGETGTDMPEKTPAEMARVSEGDAK